MITATEHPEGPVITVGQSHDRYRCGIRPEATMLFWPLTDWLRASADGVVYAGPVVIPAVRDLGTVWLEWERRPATRWERIRDRWADR